MDTRACCREGLQTLNLTCSKLDPKQAIPCASAHRSRTAANECNLRGCALRKEGLLQEALEQFSAALDHDPAHFKAFFNRAFTCEWCTDPVALSSLQSFLPFSPTRSASPTMHCPLCPALHRPLRPALPSLPCPALPALPSPALHILPCPFFHAHSAPPTLLCPFCPADDQLEQHELAVSKPTSAWLAIIFFLINSHLFTCTAFLRTIDYD